MVRVLIVALVLAVSIPGVARLVRSQERQPPTLKDGTPSPAMPRLSASITGRERVDNDDLVRVETNLVTVPASVSDRVGRYITDLRKEDFQIFEDGVEQEVAVFAPVEQPFTILFVLDTSGSMTPHMAELGRAANAFVEQLRPNDHLIAATFSDSSKLNVLFQDTRVGELQKGLRLRSRMGDRDTLIYDAVDDALSRMKKIRGRKSIVLFSDGVGAGIFSSAKDNLHKAEEQDALIYTVQFGSFTSEPPRYVNAKEYFRRIEEINGYMRDLAQKTGGRHYLINNLANLGQTFGLVADELRRQYSLGYYPKKRVGASATRKIKVKVRNRQDVAVQARESYLIK